MAKNPNPQPVAVSAWEAAKLKVSMTPPEDITGWSFQLNIRRAGVVLLQKTGPTVIDVLNGVFQFGLTTVETGSTIGEGDADYDVWRIDAGNEKRLTWGPLDVMHQQWKP